jgi:RNA polymerase sigma factor (TIGR02999 family)
MLGRGGTMAEALRQTVTRLLAEVRAGKRESFDRLFPLVYDELRRIARRERGGWRGGETLNTTALVHEAYLKLVDQTAPDWRSHGHFGAVASMAMRHILIDHARRAQSAKRGGDQVPTSIDDAGPLPAPGVWGEQDAERLIALDRALEKLAEVNERQARIVEMRFFGGMTIEDVAGALDVSTATVKRAWSTAQAWLYREMEA